MPITRVLHTSAPVFFPLHILKDLTIPCRGGETPWHKQVSASPAEEAEEEASREAEDDEK